MEIDDKKPRKKWLPIPGLQGYFAASDGSIKRGKNLVAVRKSDRGTAVVRIRAVELIGCRAESKTVELSVSCLVAATYHGKPPRWHERIPAHRNGNPMDCSAENLKYVPDEDAKFRFYDEMMRDPGFPLNQGLHRFKVWH